MTEEHTDKKALSVSEAMALAKGALEACVITLIGEVSEVSNKPGYKAVYFTVKDEHASLPAMMWMNKFKAAQIDLQVGMLVQLTGRFTLYAPKGRMNFDVYSLSIAGEGDLRLKVANLAKKLQAEGLMDQNSKKPLPLYPETIGLVTSPRGAAVHDVLRTLRRRFPCGKVLLAGVPVEGNNAALYLIEGINALEQAGAQLILLVRGGGSFEDLMPFNDEALARCIAQCSIPVVTGIGHEPDTSIADMVADLRTSTPTAAAEAVTPQALELLASYSAVQAHITHLLQARLEKSISTLDALALRPVLSDPNTLLAFPSQELDMYAERLQRAIPLNIQRDAHQLHEHFVKLNSRGKTLLDQHKALFATKAARVSDLSPLSILGRGYSLTYDEQGSLIKSIEHVSEGESITITVSDGSIEAVVDSCTYADRDIIVWKE